MYAVKLACVDPRRALEVPSTHPIGALYYELPWLRDLPTVRMFFRLIHAVYGKRIEASLEAEGKGPEDHDLRRALMFFENIRTDVKVGPETLSLHDLYTASLRIIQSQSDQRAPQTPESREQAIEAFVRAAAHLFHHVRTTRHTLQPR